jgi:hypothetical protein
MIGLVDRLDVTIGIPSGAAPHGIKSGQDCT